MSSTYRWYRVGLPQKNPAGLSHLLTRRAFSAGSEFGFLQLENDKKSSKLRFLWRSKVVITRVDEDGFPFTEELANVNFIDFGIIHFDEKCFFRLENPGHGSKYLLNAIEVIIGLGFTCEPLRFPFLDSADIFREADSAKMTGLSVSGAIVRDDLVARFDFVSKKGIEVEKIEPLRGLQYKVDSSAFEIIYRGLRGQVTLSSSGLAKISGPLGPMLVDLIERHLTVTVRQGK